MKSLQKIHVNVANAILVIVDAQNESLKPGGKHYNRTKARIVPGIISAINGLAERCRGAGVPIIHMQSVRTLKEPEFTVFGRKPIREIGTWAAEFAEELKPRQGEVVVQKFSHDAFYQTELDQVLQRLVPDPTRCYALLTGGALNVCLHHAVMGFHLRNYWTVVLLDCVFYGTNRDKQIALEQFSREGYPNIFLSRSDLVEVSHDSAERYPAPVPVS